MPIHANPGKLDCQCPRIGLKLTLDWLGLASDWLGRFSWNCCWLYVVLCGDTWLCFACWELCAGMKNWLWIGLEWVEIGIIKWPRIGTGFVKIGIDWKGLGPVPIARLSMAGEFAIIHPPSRLGTIPYRALVPRLSAGMASVMT